MPLEEWKLLAETVQGFALGAAAIAGGVWAAFQFVSLGQVRRARGELTKLDGEIASMRRALQGRPIVNLEISSKGLAPSWVLLTVLLRNNGTRAEILDLKQADVRATQVQFDGVSIMRFHEPVVPWATPAPVSW